MPALVAGIHVFNCQERKSWMAGTSPAMTNFMCSAVDDWLRALT